MLRHFVAMIAVGGLLFGCGRSETSADSSILLSNDGEMIVTLEPAETPEEVKALALENLREQTSIPENSLHLNSIDPVLIDQIINLGKTAWTIIEKGKPISDIKYDFATATPKGVQGLEELHSFSDLQFKSWKVEAKNFYGIKVVSLKYTVVHQFGGRFHDKGRYLATVSVIPSKVDVAWGYNVKFETSSISSSNLGTVEDPVASLTLHLKMHIKTILKTSEMNQVFQFRGDSADVVAVR